MKTILIRWLKTIMLQRYLLKTKKVASPKTKDNLISQIYYNLLKLILRKKLQLKLFL